MVGEGGEEVIRHVGEEEGVETGVLTDKLWEICVEGGGPVVEPLPVHRAPGRQDLTVFVALLHEVGLHLVAHHARVGVEVTTRRLDDDVGACGVDLLVVPVRNII